MADVRDDPGRLAKAETLLMMPDVFHHKLCGAMASEYTAVSTTGAYDMAGNRSDFSDPIAVAVPRPW